MPAVTPPSPKAIALGGLGAAAIVAAVLAVVGPDGKTVEIPFDRVPDAAKAKCAKVNAFADEACMTALGLTPVPGGDYLRVEVCGDQEKPDAGCAIPVEATAEEIPYVAGKKALVAARSDVDTGSPCACSTGANCEMEITETNGTKSWVPAPKGRTLQTWRGAGCKRKTCVELAGLPSSMPAGCR